MDLSEIALIYPSLLEGLASHPGIDLVVGREEGQVVVVGGQGTLWIGPESRRVEGQDPLRGGQAAARLEPGAPRVRRSDEQWAAEQLARLARFPHSGDLILFGAWDGQKVTAFEDQVATHGGLHGPQIWPFFASTTGEVLSPRGIDGAEEVYTRLVGIYGRYE
jgi:hypothetical protein